MVVLPAASRPTYANWMSSGWALYTCKWCRPLECLYEKESGQWIIKARAIWNVRTHLLLAKEAWEEAGDGKTHDVKNIGRTEIWEKSWSWSWKTAKQVIQIQIQIPLCHGRVTESPSPPPRKLSRAQRCCQCNCRNSSASFVGTLSNK